MILEDKTKEKYGYTTEGLNKHSDKMFFVKCDYCSVEFERKYRKIFVGKVNVNIDACNNKECQSKKRKAAFQSKYGCDAPLQNKEIMQKAINTFVKNGTTNPFSREDVKAKIRETHMRNHGVEFPAHIPGALEKRKATYKARTGYETPYQNPEVLSRVHEKIEAKYGVKHYAQTQDFREKFSKYNRVSWEDIEKRCTEKKYIPLFKYEDYLDAHQKLKFKCLVHDIVFEACIMNVSVEDNQCPDCKLNGISKAEREIADYVESLGFSVLKNKRDIIPPYEIDVFVPEVNVGIEFHGLIWHSEYFSQDSQLHRKKFMQAKDKNIFLIQIFEDEWRDKIDVCKSLISSKLNKNKKKNARDCTVSISTDKKKVASFFNENHLQGSVSSEMHFVLLDKHTGDIVSALSLRKPFNSDDDRQMEIARFACLKGCNVRGAFQKLLKPAILWCENKNINSIMTYSDCRYSVGRVYEKAGFSFISHTVSGYSYTDLQNRFNRFKFRATPKMTEKEVAASNGVYRLYDAGNYRWELPLKSKAP